MKALSAVLATLAVALLVPVGVATAGDDATSMSYISYLERYATLRPAEEGETLEAQINMPVLSGDRLETSRGARVEIVLADGSLLWVDEFTTIDFDALAFSRELQAERNALYVAGGSVVVEIPETALGEATTRVETPAGAVYLHRPGFYRLDIDGGGLRVEARAGLAELPAGMGSALLRGGQEAWVDGTGGIRKASVSDSGDSFWNWVASRRAPTPSGQTAKYVDARSAGRAAVLDSYGDWVYVSSFSSWMWRPRVSVTWAPYTYGRWYWTRAGWTWISYEPWGWYPSHYGSWYIDAQYGWVWCWDWTWGPAWVHWFYTPGYVGWCPRGYYDWWYWNQQPHHPYGHRWTRSALDFSGRVRLREVDPRPWTIVSAGNFGSSHLDRVRIDARRVLRDVPDGREGFVRSGPLLTSSRSVTSPSDLFDRSFRSTERAAPGLGTLLGRGGVDGRVTVSLPVRSIDTIGLVKVPERDGSGSMPGRGVPGDRDGSSAGRGSGSGTPGTLPRTTGGGDRSTPRRQVTRRSESGGGGTTSGPSSPPTTSRPSSPPSTSRPSSPPPSSRPSSPPPSSRPSSPPPSSEPSGGGSSARRESTSRSPGADTSRNPNIVIRGTGDTGVSLVTPAPRRTTLGGGQSWLRGGTTVPPGASTRSRAAPSGGSPPGVTLPRSHTTVTVPRTATRYAAPSRSASPPSRASTPPSRSRTTSSPSARSYTGRSVSPRTTSFSPRPSSSSSHSTAAPKRSSASSGRTGRSAGSSSSSSHRRR